MRPLTHDIILMRVARLLYPALAGLLLLASCAKSPVLEKPETREQVRETPLEARISSASEAVLDQLHASNVAYGLNIQPRAARDNHPMAALVKKMIARLPDGLKKLAEPHLLGIYLVEDNFGTATTQFIKDKQEQWRFGYITFNLSRINKNANDWATWKERSVFRPDNNYRLKVVLEKEKDNTLLATLQFIFLRELGHLLAVTKGLHGHPKDNPLPPATLNSPFINLSWEHDEASSLRSRWHPRFTDLNKVRFYAFDKALLSLAEAEGLYSGLASTNFPTLFGSLSIYEDVKESFALYVHTRVLKKPYRVELYKNGQLRLVFNSCIRTGGCLEKVVALEQQLEIDPGHFFLRDTQPRQEADTLFNLLAQTDWGRWTAP